MISLFLGACSSSSTDVDIPTVALDGTLTLKASVSSIGTRAVDIAVQNGAVSQLKSVDLVFLKGNAGSQKVLSVLHMTSSQIKNLLSAEGLKHFDDRKLITGVVLVSNLPHGVDGIVEGMTVTEVSSYVNRMMFDRIQPGRDIEKEGIKNAPTYGLDEVLIESVDGNYFANIKLKPLISRIQAHRMVAFDDTKVSDLKVTRLFLDNFIEDNKNPEIRFTVGTTAGDALDNLLGKFKTIFEFADSGIVNLDQTIDNKTYAYHVFPQKVKVVSLTNEQVAEAKSSTGFRLSKVQGGIDKMVVYANRTGKKQLSLGMTEVATVLDLRGTSFQSIQPKEGTGIGTGIKNAPLTFTTSDFGNGEDILDGNQKPTGVKLYKVTAKLVPDIARAQVSGKVKYETTRMENFKVSLISLDGFIVDNQTEKFTINQATFKTSPSLVELYSADNVKGIFEVQENFDFTAGDRNYAYHLFNQEVTSMKKADGVRLIMAFQFDEILLDDKNLPTGEKKTNLIKYQTLRLAKGIDESNVDVKNALSIKGGNIYDIKLHRIDWNGDGVVDDNDIVTPETGTDTPNPSDEFKDLSVLVEVTPWNLVITIPTNNEGK